MSHPIEPSKPQWSESGRPVAATSTDCEAQSAEREGGASAPAARNNAVIHIIPSLYFGGMEKAVLQLCAEQRSGGINAHVVAFESVGELRELAETLLVPITGCAGRPNIRAAVAHLRRQINVVQPKVLHSHTGTLLPASVTSLLSPQIIHVHTRHGFTENANLRSRMSERLGSMTADHIICVSEQLAEDTISVWKINPMRVGVIRNGVSMQSWSRAADTYSKERTLRVVMLCRLVAVKNVPLAIRAIAHARSFGHNIHLRIAGDGPDRARCESLVEALNLQHYVEFLGFRDDTDALLRDSDAFLQSSVSEGLSVALLEAMAAGCLVAATNVGETGAITAGLGGVVLSASEDETALSAGLCKLAALRPDERHAQGCANQARVAEEASLGGVVRKHRDLYRALTDRCSKA